MKIQKGIVKYKDREDIVCTYGVTDDGRQYYFLDENDKLKFKNGNRVASTALVEAIDPMVKANNVGVIDDSGKEIIPFTNRTIRPISDDVILVETANPVTPSVIDAVNLKNDPLSATKLVSTPALIKDKLNSKMGSDGRYVFNDQFSEATVCDINGNNLVNGEYYSFIGLSGGKLFLSKNTPETDIAEYSLLPPEVQSDITPAHDNSVIDVSEVEVPKEVVENALTGDSISSEANEAVGANHNSNGGFTAEDVTSESLNAVQPIAPVEDTSNNIVNPFDDISIPTVSEDELSSSIDAMANLGTEAVGVEKTEKVGDVTDDIVDIINGDTVSNANLEHVDEEAVHEETVSEEVPTEENTVEEKVEKVEDTPLENETVSEEVPAEENTVAEKVEDTPLENETVSEEVPAEENTVAEKVEDTPLENETVSEEVPAEENMVEEKVEKVEDTPLENETVSEEVPTEEKMNTEDSPVEEVQKIDDIVTDHVLEEDDKDAVIEEDNDIDVQGGIENTTLDDMMKAMDEPVNFGLDDSLMDDDVFKDSLLKVDTIRDADDFSDDFGDSMMSSNSPSTDSIMADVAKSMVELMKQNKDQKEIIANNQDKINKLNDSRKKIAARATALENANAALAEKNRGLEEKISSLQSMVQSFEEKIRGQSQVIAKQSRELDVLRPQLEGKEDLKRVLEAAKRVISNSNTSSYDYNDTESYYRRVA